MATRDKRAMMENCMIASKKIIGYRRNLVKDGDGGGRSIVRRLKAVEMTKVMERKKEW